IRFDIEKVCGYIESRFKLKYAPIVVAAEGAIPQGGDMMLKDASRDAFGHVKLSGIGDWLAGEVEKRTGKEARCIVLGHIQRVGTSTASERGLATRFGLHAIDAVHDGDWGKMVALHGSDVVRVPVADAIRQHKTVDVSRYAEAEVFFG